MHEVPSSIPSLHRDLHDIYGARLQSIVAHGLGARESSSAHAGHADHETPRVETLVIVDTLSADDLRACAARVGSWHDAGLATPLVLAANEFARALDAFPLEFGAILADHVVVWGRSPFDGLSVDPADLRRACEVQARGHLLHLREGYLETRGRGDALAVLIVQSAPAFAALLRSIIRLQGVAAADRGAVARHAERLLGVSRGIEDVVRLADVTEIASEEATRMFPPYLEAVSRLVDYVDGWSTSR